MAPRKPAGKRRSTDSGVEPDRGALAQERKDQRIALFLSDFDQQAQESAREMRKELDSLLQTAQKALAVELLEMPVAIRKMRRRELLGACPQRPAKPGWPGRRRMRCGAFCSCAPVSSRLKPGGTSDFYFSFLSNIFLVKVTTIVEYEDAKHISAKKISKKVSLF
ncbi:BORE2 protein, partial [Geococcyx californianus]|nr:BORE2 protein [Geococcyx californianus]